MISEWKNLKRKMLGVIGEEGGRRFPNGERRR
jgi:hypothetical protein